MWLNASTHLVAFVVGVFTWLPFTIWEGRRVASPDQEAPVTRPPRRLPLFAAIILTASAFLVGLGIQQAVAQRNAASRDTCYEAWGVDVIDTLVTRTDATKRLDKARESRDDAVDNIVLVLIAIRARPPQAQRSDFAASLTQFAEAKSRLDRVSAATTTTRAENPYPRLSCD